jgi:hypothetical protein
MKTRLILLAVALLLVGGRAASAGITPATTEYIQKTQPAIEGTLVSIDDRQMVIDTKRGERVTLLIDSRTMLPADHAAGTEMRVEFKVLDNGSFYAERLIPFENMSESERQLAMEEDEDEASPASYQQNTTAVAGDQDEEVAGNQGNGETAAQEQAEERAEHEDHGTLPQTASSQPRLALIGLISLAAAATLAGIRRRGRSAS